MDAHHDPVAAMLETQRALVLDGALATELEARGADLSGGLWSARILKTQPELIRDVHLDYLRAGARCLTTASYQATVQGFVERGASEAEAVVHLQHSVALALEARARFEAESEADAGRALVAASVGPYGAYLADGSEYTGDYDLDLAGLTAFHRQRFAVLANSGCDLLACETIPSAVEALALQSLLQEHPTASAWLCFSCRDDTHLWDGTPLHDAAAPLLDDPQVVALGINCTAPQHALGLIGALSAVTNKPIAVYPNSGEDWHSASGQWRGRAQLTLAAAAKDWFDAGARLIGGCCRTTPADIREVAQALG